MVGISVVTDVEGLLANVTLTGLSAGTRYDVYRLRLLWDRDDDRYDRMLPDRRSYWSAVAHRIGWEATSSTHSFRDYEAPRRPFAYFVVPTTAIAPYEYNWENGDYPLSRGDLGTDVVHFDREIEEKFAENDRPYDGNLLMRSTKDLGLYVDACLYDMDEVKYTARGSEFPVIGRQFPLYVADTREARRGTFTLLTDSLAQYEDVREIVFPQTGRLSPVWIQAASNNVMLLDDMLVVPLDVSVEQAGKADSDRRFITVQYVEIDPTAGMPKRTGDNDVLIDPPVAGFTTNNRRPRRKERVTLYDQSTGQITEWYWTISRVEKGVVSKKYGPGPHRVSWGAATKHWVKLRVTGPGGASVKQKTFWVQR